MPRTQATIKEIYRRLYKRYGPQLWWPGNTKLEIIVGAVLTQNTNWNNVEKAIQNLKDHRALNVKALKNIPPKKLADLIKPSGFFNVKTKRLKNFVHFLFKDYGGRLGNMAKEPLEELRAKILSVNGIGKETADSILLYAFGKPAFVVDAYTKRLLYRHALINKDQGYDDMQEIFRKNLNKNTRLFNEYHALIVRVGKDFCKTTPRCEACPLNTISYSIKQRCPRCYRFLPKGNKRCSACRT